MQIYKFNFEYANMRIIKTNGFQRNYIKNQPLPLFYPKRLLESCTSTKGYNLKTIYHLVNNYQSIYRIKHIKIPITNNDPTMVNISHF